MAELITGFNRQVDIEQQQLQEAQLSQFLTFRLAGKLYAIGILDVDEIIEPTAITELPHAPAYLRGVFNLRGSAVPVIDLTARMGHGQTAINKRSCIVLVEVATATHQQLVGLLVDAVNEIVDIAADHMQPAPNIGADLDTRFIQAMARVDEEFFILLDVQHLLSTEQVSQLSQLAGAASLEDASRSQAEPS